MSGANKKTWWMIGKIDSTDPLDSLGYRGTLMLYPERKMAMSDYLLLLAPGSRKDYGVVPVELIVAQEEEERQS